MSRKKYDIDYADDVAYNDESEEWDCMGIYAEDEGVATTLANMFELEDKENNK